MAQKNEAAALELNEPLDLTGNTGNKSGPLDLVLTVVRDEVENSGEQNPNSAGPSPTPARQPKWGPAPAGADPTGENLKASAPAEISVLPEESASRSIAVPVLEIRPDEDEAEVPTMVAPRPAPPPPSGESPTAPTVVAPRETPAGSTGQHSIKKVESSTLALVRPVGQSSVALVPESQESAPSPATPPPFRGTLRLDQLDLKALEKALAARRRSQNLKKLDCLGYFAARFEFVAYFSEQEGSSLMQGVLGYGTPALVGEIRERKLGETNFPGVLERAVTGKPTLAALSELPQADQASLRELGFPEQTARIGVFPMLRRKSLFGPKALVGVWIAGTSQPALNLEDKERKALARLLAALKLLIPA